MKSVDIKENEIVDIVSRRAPQSHYDFVAEIANKNPMARRIVSIEHDVVVLANCVNGRIWQWDEFYKNGQARRGGYNFCEYSDEPLTDLVQHAHDMLECCSDDVTAMEQVRLYVDRRYIGPHVLPGEVGFYGWNEENFWYLEEKDYDW